MVTEFLGTWEKGVMCQQRWREPKCGLSWRGEGCVFVASCHHCGSHFGSFCLTSYLEFGTGEVVVHAMKAWGSGGIAPLVLNLCIRCRRAVRSAPQLPTLPLGKNSCGTHWAGGWALTIAKLGTLKIRENLVPFPEIEFAGSETVEIHVKICFATLET